MHRIIYDGKKLKFPDHPEMAREKKLFEFGARCRCLEVQQGWAQRVRRLMPEPLRPAFDQWREARSRGRRLAESRHEGLDLLNAVTHRVEEAVRAALARCNYRRNPKRKHETEIVVGTMPGARMEVAPGPSLYSWRTTFPDSRMTIWVGYSWVRAVHQAGLAVIDGRLVLAALTEDELRHRKLLRARGCPLKDSWWAASCGEEPDLSRGPLVMALRQGRGYSVRPRLARVVEVPGPDGQPRKVLRPCGP
jgi:hypothetical protein